MLEESNEAKAGQWPGVLGRKDWDNIVELRAQHEMEKRYNREIQALCRTLCFGTATNKMPRRSIDKSPLNDIVHTAIEKAPLISSLVFSVRPTRTTRLPGHAVTMKLVGIFVILCRSAHRNNSNYLPLMIALYLYFAGA